MSRTEHWDHSSNSEGNHTRAAQLLATELDWSGLWVGGGSPDNSGNIYVNVCEAYTGAPTDSIGREGVDWFFVAQVAK